MPISFQDYKLDLLGDLLSEESLNASIEKQQKEQQYRMDNYWKIANTRNILFYRIGSYVAKELLSVYNNYVTPYVEMDQELAEEAESFYEEFKGVADYVRESVHTGENTVRGFKDAAVGMVDGLYTLALVCTPEVQEMYWAGELDAEMEQRIEGFYDVSTLMVTDPGEFVDVVGQSIADTYETEGMAYMVGGGLFELAAGKGVTKVIEKIGDLADIGKTTKVANLLDEGGLDTVEDITYVARKTQKSIIESVENSAEGSKGLTNFQKGNYGEMKMDEFFESQGYERISTDRVTDLNTPTHQGIDGVYYKDGPPPEYIIGEAKYGTSNLNKRLADGTNQMDDDWIAKRIEKAIGEEEYEKYLENKILYPDCETDVLLRINSDCTINEPIVLVDGNIVK